MAEAAEKEEDETKLLVWPEVVAAISDKAQYFLKNTSRDDLNQLLNRIEKQSGQLGSQTSFEEIRQSIHRLSDQIEDARARIESGEGQEAKS